MTAARASGTGPGPITADGCAVDLYALLPARDEPALIHRMSPDGSVLDLGAGVGRLADPLALLGHRVVAVDSSPEMLARVRHADPVVAGIEGLRLDERFDVVLLTSHLVNTPDVEQRDQLLATVAHHVGPGGLALIEWHPPSWFDGLRPGPTSGSLGEMAVVLDVERLDERGVTATVSYACDARRWTQTFTAARLSQAELDDALRQHWLEPRGTVAGTMNWLRADQPRSRMISASPPAGSIGE